MYAIEFKFKRYCTHTHECLIRNQQEEGPRDPFPSVNSTRTNRKCYIILVDYIINRVIVGVVVVVVVRLCTLLNYHCH